MFDRSVARIIDLAIAEVGRVEFNRLSDDLDVVQVRDKISYALNQLDRLNRNPKYVMGSGGEMLPIPSMPDYVSGDQTNDEWLALLYMLWYQPRQVLLARDVFSSSLDRGSKSWLSRSDRAIEIFDYGCGTLAGLFGLTIALSEHQTIRPASITVFNHDISQAMLILGRKVWSQFKSEASTKNTLGSVARISKSTRVSFNNTQSIVPTHWRNLNVRQTGVPLRFVSAFHCVYKENKDEVSADLASLLRSANPDAFVLTGRNSNMSYRLLGQALPGRWVPADFPNLQDSSYLGYDDYARQTTYLRRWIRKNYMDTSYAHSDESFLRQRVPWSYDVASYLVWVPS